MGVCLLCSQAAEHYEFYLVGVPLLFEEENEVLQILQMMFVFLLVLLMI